MPRVCTASYVIQRPSVAGSVRKIAIPAPVQACVQGLMMGHTVARIMAPIMARTMFPIMAHTMIRLTEERLRQGRGQ